MKWLRSVLRPSDPLAAAEMRATSVNDPSSPDDHRSATFPAAVAASLLLCVAAVWCVAYLPTNDGPRHVFAIHAANHLDDASTGWGAHFERVRPITSHGFGMLFAPLDRLLPWRVALRLALTAMVALWAVGAILFARSLHPKRGWLGLALSGAAFQWTLYMGFFSFYVATAFGLLVLALAFRARSWGFRERALLSGLLLLQAIFHVVAAAATGWVLAVLALSRAGPRGWGREAARLAVLGAPAAAIAVALVALDLGAPVSLRPAAGTDATGAWPELWTLGRCFVGGPAWRAWPLTLLAGGSLALGVTRLRRDLGADDRALLVSGAVLLAAALLLPLHVASWEFVSVRFVPAAVGVLVVALPLERLGRETGRGAAALLAGFALASPAWAIGYHRVLEAGSADALSGLEADIVRDGPRLPVMLGPDLGRPAGEPAIPFAVPLANLGHLYAIAQGGVVPYNFSVNPKIHHLMYVDEQRRYPAIPPDLEAWGGHLASPEGSKDPALRAAIATRAAGYGSAYQDVILWGKPADGELLIHRGYVPDWRRGGLLLARFEGCPLSLSLPAEPALDPGAAVEIGWYPLDETARRVGLSERRPEPGDRISVPIPRAPCGAVWLRVRADASGRRLACRGADDAGRLVVRSTRKTPVVRCDWAT
jgi:hypothetical protein